MIESRRRVFLNVIRTSDCVAAYVAFFITLFTFIQEQIFSFQSTQLQLHFTTLLVILLFMITSTSIRLLHFSFYLAEKPQFFFPGLLTQINQIVFCGFLDIIAIVLLSFVDPLFTASLTFCSLYIILMLGLVMLFRWTVLIITKYYLLCKRSRYDVLIVGTNERAVEFYKHLKRNRFLGYRAVGFIDDENYSGHKIKFLGNLSTFPKVLRERVVDSVVVFLPLRSFYDKTANILAQAEVQGISLYYMTNIFESEKSKMLTTECAGKGSVLMHTAPVSPSKMFLKRLFDIAFASAVLIGMLPILLAAAICIKATDGGPIFFLQKRVGYAKRRFVLLKFRTMIPNAAEVQSMYEDMNEMDGAVFKIKKDPRITKVGFFLRKYGIDEFPQFINVLWGDMSVVGPRPLALRDYKLLREDWLRRRFSVRPGITCYWQCMRNRNNLQFEEWMNLDMEYIDNWSLLEDMKICVKTVPAVLSGTGV